MQSPDLYWLAGLLEGKGCFRLSRERPYAYPTIKLHMNDEDVVARVAGLLGVSYCRIKGKQKDTFQTHLMGSRAILMMQLLSPLLGIRRRAKIAEILEQCSAYRAKMEKLGRV